MIKCQKEQKYLTKFTKPPITISDQVNTAKLVLGITLASIFLGVFVLALIGLIVNLSS